MVSIMMGISVDVDALENGNQSVSETSGQLTHTRQ
jgi:hypothetical protein